MKEEDIPVGHMEFTPGMKIDAAGQTVGKLDEIVREPQSDVITFLLMREGHLWGKKDVTIPVSAVDFIDEYTIYLKIDKDAVAALPATPANSK